MSDPARSPVKIYVAGHPVAKGRPRMTRAGHAYTPAKTVKAEQTVSAIAMVAMAGRPPFDGPVACRIFATFAIPKSWPRWKRELAAAGRVAHTARPDSDNIEKLACDACNGIVWLDDAQVVDMWSVKRYGPAPGVEIFAIPHGGVCSQTQTRAEADSVSITERPLAAVD